MNRPPAGRDNRDKFFLVSDSSDSLLHDPSNAVVDAPPLPVGTIVGNYQLEERLGVGGMGEVYRATHARLGGTVAVKLIHPDRLKAPAAARRFLREVQASAQLDHPHIVRALDAGEENGRYFLVLEYIDGDDLETHVERAGPLSLVETLRAGRELGLALQYLHANGLVHRDVKPSNLIRVRRTGSFKLLDLGLTRFQAGSEAAHESSSTTQQGVVLGTPDFIAPEQAINPHRADIRSDLYSAGCTLYFLLTGAVPYPGGTAVEKLIRQHQDPIPDVRTACPDLPSAVAELLRRVMAKSPEERFQSPADFVVAISNIEAGRVLGQPAADPGLPSDFERLLDHDSRALPALPVRRHQERDYFWTIPVAILLAGAAVMLAWYSRSGSPSSPPTTPEISTTPIVEDGRRDELFQEIARSPGTSAAVAAASQLRFLGSPLDSLAPNTFAVPALTLGDPKRRHPLPAQAIAFAAGRIATVGDDRVVRIWDSLDLRLVTTLDGHSTPLRAVSISANGIRVAAASGFRDPTGHEGFERALQVWQASTGKVILRLDHDHGGWTISGLLTEDGKQLFAGQYGVITRWNVDKNEMIQQYTAPNGMDWVNSLAISQDGRFLYGASNYENQIHAWDVQSGKHLLTFSGHSGSVGGVALNSSDDRLATFCTDGTVRVWKTSDASVVTRIELNSRAPMAVVWFVRDLVVGWEDGSIRGYDPATGKARWVLNGHFGPVTGIAVDDKYLISTGRDGTVRKWDPARGVELDPPPPQSSIARLAFSDRDRRLVAYPDFARPIVINLQARESPAFNWTPADWQPFGQSQDGMHAVGWNGRGELVRWLATAAEPEQYPIKERRINPPHTLSADGGRLLHRVRSSNRVRWTDLTTGAELQDIEVDGDPSQLAVSADGRLALVVAPKVGINVIELATGNLIRTIPLRERSTPETLRFAPDSNSFMATIGSIIWRTSVREGKPQRVGEAPGIPTCLAISADDRFVAVGCQSGEIWYAGTNGVNPRIIRTNWPVRTLAFSVDGKALAVGFWNGMIVVYKLPADS